MNLNKKGITLILLLLGAMIVSGCAAKETIMAYNEARELFQKATIAGARKCAPCEYATAEANLAIADHEMKYYWREIERLDEHTRIVKEKSLEALKLTPCEKVAAAPPAPAPPPPPPPEPPKPAPPPEPPKPAPPPPPPPPEPPKPAPPAPPPKPAPMFDNVYFNENKTNIDPISAKALDRNGMILKENPNIKVEIGGHTDSAGSEKANQKISEKRALSAKKYIQDKFNIPDSRLVVKSYGSTKPVADNKTQEGRSKNRRVEFRVIP